MLALGDGRPNNPPMGGAVNTSGPAVDTCFGLPIAAKCTSATGQGGRCTASGDCIPDGDVFTDQDSMI